MNVLHIAVRELRAIFATAVGWLVLCAFLQISGVMWYFVVTNYVDWSNQLVFDPYAATQLNYAEYLLSPFFGNVAVVLMAITPALSMRLFSEELKQRTIELLLTSPVSTTEIVLGKFFGAVGFVAVMLLCTAHYPVSLAVMGDPDPGLVVCGYLGLLLLAAAVIAMGMLFSALTSNQIVAVVLTFTSALTLFLVGLWATEDPDGWLVQLSTTTHITDLFRGAVRLSDMMYFAGFIAFFLFATHQRIESARWQ